MGFKILRFATRNRTFFEFRDTVQYPALKRVFSHDQKKLGSGILLFKFTQRIERIRTPFFSVHNPRVRERFSFDGQTAIHNGLEASQQWNIFLMGDW